MTRADAWIDRLAAALPGPVPFEGVSEGTVRSSAARTAASPAVTLGADAVHAIRVASRRLDAWLVLGGHRVLRDDLARLRAALGRLRDLDVLMGLAEGRRGRGDADPSEPFLTEGALPALRDQRTVEAARLAGLLAGEWPRALVEALALVPPPEDARARRRVPRFLDRVVARARRFEELSTLGSAAPDGDEALHDLRRAVRRARFALDWMESPSPALEDLHDALGRVTDLLLVRRWLLEQRGGAGEEALSGIDAAIARRRREAHRRWMESAVAMRDLRRAWK